jgi:hypothetical protein
VNAGEEVEEEVEGDLGEDAVEVVGKGFDVVEVDEIDL